MSEDIINRLRANDPTLTNLEFDLRRGPTRDVAGRQICSSVQENSNVRRLKIDGCRDSMNIAIAKELAAAIERMPFLEDFEIMWCNLNFRRQGRQLAEILISSLSGRDHLRRLDFGNCNVGVELVQTISDLFIAHNSLQELHLFSGHNHMNKIKGTALGSLLAHNKSLKYVRLGIGSKGFKAIADGISTNRTLEKLDLIRPHDEERAGFKKAFKKALCNDESIKAVITDSNHTLKELNFKEIAHHIMMFNCSAGKDICSLLALNGEGPEKALRRKITRFSNENPGLSLSMLSLKMDDVILPSAIEKIGRLGSLHVMYDSVRDIPNLFIT